MQLTNNNNQKTDIFTIVWHNFFFQDPTDPDCPIIRGYLRHLKFDPSPLVRRTVVKCIGASKATLKSILDRTRDVDDLVRKAAYKFVAEKVSQQRVQIKQDRSKTCSKTEWDMKSKSPIIWNPDKWLPFCQKPFEIQTKILVFKCLGL